jgi:hypothetical integral membrane protein (TIGR02206 family)
MQQYFDYHYDGPAFELFGAGHLLTIVIVAAIAAFLIWGWQNPGEEARRRARMLIVGTMLLIEVSWHGWNVLNDSWNFRQHLPLHSCALSVWGSIYVVWTRSFRVYEILFFIGTAGAIQTLLTPDAGAYGLPHFRALQTLAAHGMIVIAMVYMTAIEGFRPAWKSLWKTMLIGNVYLVIVTAINYLIGSNYMYTLRKPATASLLDMMGPWPWYILGGEIIALVMFLLLYLPFAVSDRRAASMP